MNRDAHDRIAPDLGAEPAAAILGDIDEIVDLDAGNAGDARQGGRLALRGAVHVALAVLPIRHAGSRFEAVVREVLRDEGLVEHECGFGHVPLDIAVGPLVRGLTCRELSFLDGGEIGGRPLDGLHGPPAGDDIAVAAGVRSAREEAVERIDGKRQRLEFNQDPVDRVLGQRLAHRGDRKDGLAGEHRLIRQQRLDGRSRFGQIVDRQHGHDAVHRERLGRVDPGHARMRHRAVQQAAEHHAIGAEVLGVLRFSGNLCPDIGRNEILTKQCIRHLVIPPFRAEG